MKPTDRMVRRRPATGAPAILVLVGRIVLLAGLLWLFLFSIGLLGTAFKVFGREFSETLIRTTTNPVVGLMIGLLATSLIQSSSTTTSITVGLVAADALTVSGAVPIVMGANMGTTITNTIVAMGSVSRRSEFTRAFAGATMHDFFNLLTILILFPLEQATHYLERSATWLSSHLAGAGGGVEFHSPVKAVIKPVTSACKHLVQDTWGLADWLAGFVLLAVALGLLFLSLYLLTQALRRFVLNRAENAFNKMISRSALVGMALGLAVTVSVQSSSVTTSLMVPMIGAGIINLEAAFAVTLGANVGTTVTALLASLTGNLAALTVALVHLLFNLSGILLIFPFRPLRRFPINLARRLAIRASRRRIFILYYVAGVFFLMPLGFVLVSKLF